MAEDPLVRADGTKPRQTADRNQSVFSLRNKLFRVAWGGVWLLFARFTPPQLYKWRVMLLRLFGAQIGRNVKIYGSTIVWHPGNLTIEDHVLIGPRVKLYNQGSIAIGKYTVVSQDASICASTHNVNEADFPLLLRPVTIAAHCWVAAEAFVGPGVTMGEGGVLGARAVAMRSLEPWTFYSGNPAAPLKSRTPITTFP